MDAHHDRDWRFIGCEQGYRYPEHENGLHHREIEGGLLPDIGD